MASLGTQPPAQSKPPTDEAPSDGTWTWVGLGASLLGIICAVLALIQLNQGKSTSSQLLVAGLVALLAFAVFFLWARRLLAQPEPQVDPRYAYATHNGYGPNGSQKPADGNPAPQPYTPVVPSAPLYSQEALQQSPVRAAEPNPFLHDPLFTLEAPAKGIRRFILAKDPDRMCEDGFACDAGRGIYAVTDGVSQSFVSAPWARIVAKGFARHPQAFNDEASFTTWLEGCANEWREWMTNTWMATLNEQRQKRGERPGDWTSDIEDKGAQATLLGCMLTGSGAQREIRVIAIGDSQFLLFHRDGRGAYQLRGAFPLQTPEDFSLNPATLLTRRDPRLAALAWSRRQGQKVAAQSGDVAVLATDSVAKWLMTQALQGQPPAPVAGAASASGEEAIQSAHRLEPYVSDWTTMLTTRDQAEFENLVHREIHAGRMDEDDVTVVVIPIE